MEFPRRVVFSRIPRGTSLAQLLRVVRGEGGIDSAEIFDTSKLVGSGDRTASVKFVRGPAAEAFVEFVGKHPFAFRDTDDNIHYPEVWLSQPTTSSLAYSTRDTLSPLCGFTRGLRAADFPAKAVWFFLCALGLCYVVDANFDTDTSALTVEYVSIFHATLAHRILMEGRFPYYQPNRVHCNDDGPPLLAARRDSTDGNVQGLQHENLIVNVDSDHLERRFNRPPYNQNWPVEWFPIMRTHGLTPRSHDHDAMLKTINDCVSFSRNHWSWETSDDHKEVMSTLEDALWKDAWEKYFQTNVDKTEDLQRWSDYAAIAHHRREKTAQQGLQPWEIPRCMDGCEFGCGALKEKTLPQVIQDFLDGRIEG